MIRHVVLFTFSDDATDDDKAAIAAGLDRMAELDCVSSFSHGPDAGLVDGNWDYTVVADFEDAPAYGVYANDADHLALIADVIKPAISGRAAVQFQI
ncbi:MAG: Dabb family protein [Actinomycetota bacterium]